MGAKQANLECEKKSSGSNHSTAHYPLMSPATLDAIPS